MTDLVQLKLDNLDMVCGIVDRLEGEIAQLKSWIKSQKSQLSFHNYDDLGQSDSNVDNVVQVQDPRSPVYDQVQSQNQQEFIPSGLIIDDINIEVKEEYNSQDVDDNSDPLDINGYGDDCNNSNFIDEDNDIDIDDQGQQDQDQSLIAGLPMDDLVNEFDQSVNDKEYKYQVPISSKFFSKIQKRNSTQKHRFPCSVCGVRFTRLFNMTRHMKTHVLSDSKSRSKVSLFKCDFENCQHAYGTMVSLKKHKEEHTGIETFECTKCEPPRLFYERSNLRKHFHNVHFVCNTRPCKEREFPSRRALISHKRNSHNINHPSSS